MPKFYFHLHNDTDVTDGEGKVLPDLAAAHTYACKQARAMLGQLVKDEGRIVLHHSIDIEDESGQVLSSIYFRDVVVIEDKKENRADIS